MNFINSENKIKLEGLLRTHIPTIEHFTDSFVERRIAFVCNKMNICTSHDLEQKISTDSSFIDHFMMHFVVPTTEMFRDYHVWQILYNDILPKIANNIPCNIWFPDSSSGEELYSLCIILQELSVTENVVIYASNRSLQAIETIKKGVFSTRQEALFSSNFSNLGLSHNFSDYYLKSHNEIYMNASLLKPVAFIHSPSILLNNNLTIHLTIFRNSLLYYTKQMHHIILSLIYKNLTFGGYLIMGLNDNNSIFEMETLFTSLYEDERIYKKNN